MLNYYPLYSCSVDEWLRAGITLADSVVILREPIAPNHHTDNTGEHFVDASHIMAVQKLTNLCPHVAIVTELHYRYNIRFMRFTDCDYHFMGNFKTLVRCYGVAKDTYDLPVVAVTQG